MKVRDHMTVGVVTVTPGTAFKETAELLLEHGITGVPVVDGSLRLLGIVTEADLMSKEAFGADAPVRLAGVGAGRRHRDRRWAGKADGLTAGDVMTTNVVTAAPGEQVAVAARRMLTRKVKRLPVVEPDGRLVGIISRHDILRIFDRPDAAIAADLAARLDNPLHAPEAHCVVSDVVDGVAILQGWVEEAWDLDVVEAVARNTPGVIDVVNNVTRTGPGD